MRRTILEFSFIFFILIKVIVLALVLGVSNIALLTSTRYTFGVSVFPVRKALFIFASTSFYLSILVCYKMTWFTSEIGIFFGELALSLLLGIFWSWLFLLVASSLDYKVSKTSPLKLVGFFSAIAFGLFCFKHF